MKRSRGPEIGISIVFGFIAFITCVFLFSVWYSLIIGGTISVLLMFVLNIILNQNDKKYIKLDEQMGQHILLRERANFYEAKLVCNGFLLLTETKLVFISREKKEELRRDILISDIKTVEYGKVFRHILGLKIVTHNDSSFGFSLAHAEQFIEKLNELMGPHCNR